MTAKEEFENRMTQLLAKAGATPPDAYVVPVSNWGDLVRVLFAVCEKLAERLDELEKRK